MRILIADDSAMSRVLLRSTLQRWGYEVITAEDGNQAWDILSGENAPPIAILDWVMPGLTGTEVCRRVRKNAREPYTYLLLLTSKNTKEETVEGMDSGADDYIVKPFHEHELQVRLRAGKRIIDLQINLLNAREELRERAEKDVLTMLPNRLSIRTVLESEIARCHRDRRSVGIVLLDLDRFKFINDTYGHLAGDAVLRETAHRFKTNMRPYDQIGRYGGEEFLVVLPNCDLEQAHHQADRMRLILEQKPMYVDGKQLRVTASFGVTISDGTERPLDQYIRIADEALYMAKGQGRNCVASLNFEAAGQPSLFPLNEALVQGTADANQPETVTGR
ncbi:MAG TPA: diguanylate cyclase [Bryobacteraceae bacterium]|nr:diguanylate cyclase [Bryobacteraceae bacterium]